MDKTKQWKQATVIEVFLKETTATTIIFREETKVCARLHNGIRRCEDELSPSFTLRGVSTWCYCKGTYAWAHTMHSNKAVIWDVRSDRRLIPVETLHVDRDKCGYNKHPCDVTTQSTEKSILSLGCWCESPRQVQLQQDDKNVHSIHYLCPEAPFASVLCQELFQTASNYECELSAIQCKQRENFFLPD